MSVRVLTKVFACSESTLAARLVLLALADAAHDDGITWLGQAELASKAKITEPWVRKCLRELEKLGEVETRKAQRGRRRINVYRIALPGLADPNYEDLPFDIVEPFTTTEVIPRSSDTPSEADDRRSVAPTTEGLSSSPRARVDSEPSIEPSSGANAPLLDDVPAIVLTDGQNLPLNALVEECGVDPDGPRMVNATYALNGIPAGKRGGPKDGIRQMFWRELLRAAEGNPERIGYLHLAVAEPERFALALERAIHAKAATYRNVLPGAALTPSALRSWWLDLARQEPRSEGGLTPEQMAELEERAS